MLNNNSSMDKVEDFHSVEDEIIKLKSELNSLTNLAKKGISDSSAAAGKVLTDLAEQERDNLRLARDTALENCAREERAYLKALNNIERQKNANARTETAIQAENIKRYERAMKDAEGRILDLRLTNAKSASDILAKNLYSRSTEAINAEIQKSFNDIESRYEDSLLKLRMAESRSDINDVDAVKIKVAKRDANDNIVKEIRQRDTYELKGKGKSGESFTLQDGQSVKAIGKNGTYGKILDEAGKAILDTNGKEILVKLASKTVTDVEETVYEEVSQVEALTRGKVQEIKGANNTLAAELTDRENLANEMAVNAEFREEYIHAVADGQNLKQNIALLQAQDEAQEAYVAANNKAYQELILSTEAITAETELHKTALEAAKLQASMLNVSYQNILVQQKIADKELANSKAIHEAWLEELANQHITDTDSKEAQRIKSYTEYNKQLEASNKFVETAISNIPLIGVKFGEVGPTIQEQISNIKNIIKGTGKDLEGNYFDKYSAKKDFHAAMKAEGLESQGNFVERGATTLRNHVEIEKKLQAAKKDKDENGNNSWDTYLKTKAALAEAKKVKDADQGNTEAINNYENLSKQLEEALEKTGMSENEAKAAEAQEKQKQSTVNGWANTTAILANIAQKLDAMVDEIALNQAKVDTRLYGSKQNDTRFGSYWKEISYDLSATMLSPVLKEETLINNVLKAVDMGIARDVQQFGMLETIKDKIATTFDTFDGTMLRLIKIQDNNTTAARLGMEASLNELLNQMYETTEYLTSLAATVRSNLEEAEALMEGEDAVDFEYQVQKWLGSLSSVGMSQSGVTAISDALGKLAAGDIEGITNGGVGNLLVMAANNANLSIADILADGLDSSETNVLLNQMVGYMNELVDEANGNLVVQQQLAKVFGLTASDLKAATNLTGTYLGSSNIMQTIYNKGTGDTYNTMLGVLSSMADSMTDRTSLGEMLTNIWSNVQYSTAAGEASNPVLYLLNKTADILDTFAAGIPIPAITAFGTGVDTKLTVSNIMKSAAMVGGFTSSLISMIGSMAQNGGSGVGTGLLKLVGINTKVSRGSSKSSSGTATVYNASVDDMTDSATQEGEDSADQQTVEAQEESTEVSNKTMNESILSIYELLKDVVDGRNSLNVKVTNTPIEVSNGSSWTWPTTSGAGAAFNTGL